MKYVIIAYLRNVKGYSFPYDFYLCKDFATLKKNIELVRKNVGVSYSCFETYINIDYE